jgi:hypothetical protein
VLVVVEGARLMMASKGNVKNGECGYFHNSHPSHRRLSIPISPKFLFKGIAVAAAFDF